MLNLLCIFQYPVYEFKVLFTLVIALGVKVHDLGDLICISSAGARFCVQFLPFPKPQGSQQAIFGFQHLIRIGDDIDIFVWYLGFQQSFNRFVVFFPRELNEAFSFVRQPFRTPTRG
jgi:hypothetical protein